MKDFPIMIWRRWHRVASNVSCEVHTYCGYDYDDQNQQFVERVHVRCDSSQFVGVHAFN